MSTPKIIPSIEAASQISIPEGVDLARCKFEDSLAVLMETDSLGVAKFIGSAFLMEHNGNVLCLTATHNLQRADNSAPLWLKSRGLQVPLNIDFIAIYSKRHAEDRIDVAVGKLPAEIVSVLEHVRPFSSKSVDQFDPQPGVFRYVSLGFPASRNKPSKMKIHKLSEGLGIVCGTRSNVPSGQNKHQYSEQVNCFLEFDQTECVDAAGLPTGGFALYGMSGGLILRLGDYGDHAVLAGTKPPAVFPIGILIEHLQSERIIVGTRLDFVLKALRL